MERLRRYTAMVGTGEISCRGCRGAVASQLGAGRKNSLPLWKLLESSSTRPASLNSSSQLRARPSAPFTDSNCSVIASREASFDPYTL